MGSFKFELAKALNMASKARIESDEWLRPICADIRGRVLSVGSLRDLDGAGKTYRSYFKNASVYFTSEPVPSDCDLVVDITKANDLADESFECIFCSGVLEHVVDFKAALAEIHRLLSPCGILLLGVPFAQGLHCIPTDYWRFTSYGLEEILKPLFDVLELKVIVGDGTPDFPASYWVLAEKGLV